MIKICEIAAINLSVCLTQDSSVEMKVIDTSICSMKQNISFCKILELPRTKSLLLQSVTKLLMMTSLSVSLSKIILTVALCARSTSESQHLILFRCFLHCY